MGDFLREFLASGIPLPLATAAGALWALVTFRRNNRIKAAEILISLEKDYSKHIPTLLKIEHVNDYQRVYRDAISIAVSEGPHDFTKEQSAAIDCLEAALRHFYLCAAVQRLSADAGALDQLCSWYLRIFVTDRDDQKNLRRPELREYVRKYWPTLYFWAPLAAQPWPKRAWRYTLQIPGRLGSWWNPVANRSRPMPRIINDGDITVEAVRETPSIPLLTAPPAT